MLTLQDRLADAIESAKKPLKIIKPNLKFCKTKKQDLDNFKLVNKS